MSTHITATGRKERRPDGTYIALTRTFRAPIEDVWAAITEPDRLARWIGRWSGDPATGKIDVEMLYEGDDVEPEEYAIDACDAPRRLELTSRGTYGEDTPATWHLKLDLAETDGVTTLTFAQSMDDPAMAENVGPGWEYYLDRLVAAETGGDPAAIDFGGYYPALAGYYRTL
ncbi:SRPBCC family protein [Promicromonospora iranensis]|uniref:Uncharacterized protein YndB with AHSA1/START domain n=1 Tax=Promicromonospora iranensis TaxID=1105144 RepID=A0ABU2CTH0_9MICO|nr:SRPBCC family protein [Promicromonospora iranensis]MDR7384626.1 uncharacterized protein YndB with AHSA1/START domain [Promicromonospora iranensis]